MSASMEALFSSEVATLTVCGLASLSVLVFLVLVVLASFGIIDGKFLLELIRALSVNEKAVLVRDVFFRVYGGHQRQHRCLYGRNSSYIDMPSRPS